MKKKIVILGSTGSIGKQTLEILKKDKNNIQIILLTANSNYKLLLKQAKIFNVKNLIITNLKHFRLAKKKLKNKKVNLYNDLLSFNKIFKNKKIDYTMVSIMGLSGLKPTLNIIKYTRKIAIANKESIICGWSLIQKKLHKFNTEFIPIDSEHFSIWSLINGEKNKNIEKIYITASGGPFYNYSLKKFKTIKPKEALKHPNWKMGEKITIDSATMMNKVFEVMEASKIFNLNYNKISILVHPRSYIHAIVKFKNGLIKILAHDTNMTIPIFNSIYQNYEKEIQSKKLNLEALNNLNFMDLDRKKFKSVNILRYLKLRNSLYETIIVSANDELVHMFLSNQISFLDISKILLKFINNNNFIKYKNMKPNNVEDIIKLSQYVRLKIQSLPI
jgi:1-deoxy-D-xylulose-5-phosphate reductoisomerase